MKRRTFLKGLGVAMVAPATMLSRGLEAAVPKSSHHPLPTGVDLRDNTSSSPFISEVNVLKGGGVGVRHRQNDIINEASTYIGRV